MAKFIKENFVNSSNYVTYDGKFVARFKRGSAGSFITFLTKNFAVEEYFAALEAGNAPLTVVTSKGYLQPHIKKWLKEAGLPVNTAGLAMLVQSQCATTP